MLKVLDGVNFPLFRRDAPATKARLLLKFKHSAFIKFYFPENRTPDLMVRDDPNN
jgi:hypothetical protein